MRGRPEINSIAGDFGTKTEHTLSAIARAGFGRNCEPLDFKQESSAFPKTQK
jgi:hypothetical protein